MAKDSCSLRMAPCHDFFLAIFIGKYKRTGGPEYGPLASRIGPLSRGVGLNLGQFSVGSVTKAEIGFGGINWQTRIGRKR